MKLNKKGQLFRFGKATEKFNPNSQPEVVSFFSLFQYAEKPEKVMAFVGLLAACLSGLSLPMFILLYGEFTTALIDRKTPNATFNIPWMLPLFGGGRNGTNGTEEDLRLAIREDSFAFGYGMLVCVGISLVFSFLSVSMLNHAGLRQVARVRRRLVRAVLQKDMAWYDVNNEANFAVNLTEDLNNMQEGMGEKMGLFLTSVSCFVVCVVIAFFSGWKLTLTVIACVPLIIAGNGISSKIQATMVVKEQKAYSGASGVAEEVFGSIKTVFAFGGENKEVIRYKSMLVTSLKAGIRRALISGIGAGIMWFIIYAVYGLAFWYGVTLILESRENKDGIYTPSSIIIVLFGAVMGSIYMGQCLPHLEAFAVARGSATSVFNVIKAHCPIDPFSKAGRSLPDLIGNISFADVHFHYPSRTGVQVLKGLNLEILKGQKIALVGGSGCGKSTCVQLIQRLYDPVKGAVMLDGVDLRELNVAWLRSQIGVVSQEPLLFATTIYENIRYGDINANEEDIHKAAKIANAHDFILKLPEGYQTMIGQRGTQLSGGQKQRIAIARAVVRDPSILLLDEATSALDVSNEAAVQKALDHAAEGRTTIVVAHRLSTVINSDRIVVIVDGQTVESGTHQELIDLKGEYHRLLNTQQAYTDTAKTELKDGDAYLPGAYDVKSAKVDERSPSVTTMEGDAEELEQLVSDTQLQPASLARIISYSKPEWLAILVGSLATIVVGSSCPTVSILLGEIYGVMSSDDENYIREQTDFLSGMLVVLAVSVGAALFLQMYSFGHVATHLTTRLRGLTFAAILSQEPAWFDREENKVGSLTTRLSGSAADIQAVAGSSLSIVLQGITTLLFGFIISFMYSWQLTLVTSVGLPIIFFGVYYEFYVVQGQNLLEKKTIEGATKVAVEAISGIRTVASLGREETFIERYHEELKDGEAIMTRKAFMRGIIYAMGQSATFLGYGISLWYGGCLVADNMIQYKDVIKVSESLLFGVWLLGQSLAFAPGYGKAKLSAARLFQILDRQSTLRSGSESKDPNWTPQGKIDLTKVDFYYPNRPEVLVLQELSLKIHAGTSVALAGASGCGKSTIVQLIQRFYDPVKGVVALDDGNIRAMPTLQLRNQMSIVSQEPVLFNLTIGENIAYGDNSRVVSQEEIIRAAKTANIHNFIVALPSGYDTNLGKGGTQLSGGQKQRIAIARALIRNPKLLLLDEATSALDTASEAVVQAALDEASAGRTTITVGHRPASIAGADSIFVLDRGRVVEQGKYEKLIADKGCYATLNQR